MSHQTNLFDRAEGERRKEEGQKLVTKHQTVLWKDAIAVIIDQVAALGDPFTNDDVRAAAQLDGLGEPTHPNAWGAATSAASKRGDIKPCGYTTSKQPSRHGAVVRLWCRED